PAFEVQAGDAECEVRSFFDHREVVEAILAPGLFVASRQRDIALQRGLARPRHPRQKLGPRIDDRSVEPLGVRHTDRLETEPGSLEDYSARGGGAAAFAPSFVGPTQMVWMLVNSLIPYSDSSRPNPERLSPPNGSRASDATIPLMKTSPASTRSASFLPRSTSRV